MRTGPVGVAIEPAACGAPGKPARAVERPSASSAAASAPPAPPGPATPRLLDATRGWSQLRRAHVPQTMALAPSPGPSPDPSPASTAGASVGRCAGEAVIRDDGRSAEGSGCRARSVDIDPRSRRWRNVRTSVATARGAASVPGRIGTQGFSSFVPPRRLRLRGTSARCAPTATQGPEATTGRRPGTCSGARRRGDRHEQGPASAPVVPTSASRATGFGKALAA